MKTKVLHRECAYQDDAGAEYTEWLSNGTIRYIESSGFTNCYKDGGYTTESVQELPWKPKNKEATTLDKLKDSHLRNISRLIEDNQKMPTWKRQCYLAGISRILAVRTQ